MIETMYKYQFLVERNDYLFFLRELRNLGVLHLQEQSEGVPQEVRLHLEEQKMLQDIYDRLEKRKAVTQDPLPKNPKTGFSVARQFEDLTERLDDLGQELQQLRAEQAYWRPWGIFSGASLDILKNAGLSIGFFSCSNKTWRGEWVKKYPLALINQDQGTTYFIALMPKGHKTDLPPRLETLAPPSTGTLELARLADKLEQEKTALEKQLDQLAASGLPALSAALHSLHDKFQVAQVMHHTRREANEQLMILSGFVPAKTREKLEKWLEETKRLYLREKALPEDAPPILLRNGPYARLFEPIGALFGLPDYAELDLTPLFAPFFMLFFGFCLGDAGYGLIMVIGAFFYQFRAPDQLKPILRLVRWLGLATVLFGALSGTFFGINLIDNPLPGLEAARKYMLDSNQLFELALLLGLVQILFGLFLKALNQARRFGWAYAMVPVGWILILLGLLDIGLLKRVQPYSSYLAFAGLGMILLFSDPKAGLASRVGKGLWELYGITGFFGDLLSYIRLFALGISSAILGYVVNSIGLQVNNSIPYVGPVLFVIFLLVGHSANLLIASLGAFVHPLRLTFVEFYKNAGFTGGGKKYDPLRQHISESEQKTINH